MNQHHFITLIQWHYHCCCFLSHHYFNINCGCKSNVEPTSLCKIIN